MDQSVRKSLNPCFVGKCSTSQNEVQNEVQNVEGLNPCFVGKCSTSIIRNKF